jgi:hypothetical protein
LYAKSRDVWAATLTGVVVGGIIEAALSVLNDSIFIIAAGAFVGGVVAAYVLYGKIGQAAVAGILAGVLVTPFFLGLSQILAIFEVIPTPSGPTPPMSELQVVVAFIFMTNLVAGVVGGALGGAIRHRKPELEHPATVAPPGAAVAQARYCVQCGAQLPTGAVICPHCSARQPQ